ncbi:hypothetical protein F5I97DRAFT_1927097 [Phlebopus sp. FC_14]|nr:hypothetical protein F5I97DRAFT_1927097 [Phlebopus sp. FC_14]
MDASDYEGGSGEEPYDEVEAPLSGTRRTRRTNKANHEYQLKNVLKLPRATTYAAQALYDQIHASDIDLEPEYQRDVVWPEAKQVGLIDSILRNFYIPPIILVTRQHEDGSESKTCIDGKQRLTSIQRFMDGQIPHKDPHTGEKYWYKVNAASQSGRLRGTLLPEKYRRLFANKQIVCIEFQDLADSDEREIFQRVQLGMALTPAEKLQVLNTSMSSFVRILQSQYLDAEDSPLGGSTLDWDRSRGGDFRCIAQALYVIARFPNLSTIGAITQLEKWLRNPTAGRPGKGKKKVSEGEDEDLSKDTTFIERIHSTFRMLSELVGDGELRSLFLQQEWRVSPIEFVMMCLLVSVHKDNLTAREIAEKIGAMRVLTRKEHVDIRMNARVAKTMLDFIRGVESASEESKGGVKRRREDEEDEEERQSKDRKRESSPALSVKAVVSGPRSQTSSVIIPPPRPTPPDRPLALRGAKTASSSPKPPPTGPAALRNATKP